MTKPKQTNSKPQTKDVPVTSETKIESNKVDAAANKLIRQGHQCVRILETKPKQLSWCGEKPCKYR